MRIHGFRIFFYMVMAFVVGSAYGVRAASVYDLRGTWQGNAKGSIFGAEGSVTVTHQRGENFSGIVEGSNFLGSAKFRIAGKIRGNVIYGAKQGNVFQGILYGDGTIRGVMKTVDGASYRIFLRKANPYGNPYNNQYNWGGYPYGQW
jgi:hypothetical protein